jgi:hypothetical protein
MAMATADPPRQRRRYSDEYLVMHNGDVKPHGLLNGMIQSGRAEILHEYTIMSWFSVRMKLNGLILKISKVSIYQTMWCPPSRCSLQQRGSRPLRSDWYERWYKIQARREQRGRVHWNTGVTIEHRLC